MEVEKNVCTLIPSILFSEMFIVLLQRRFVYYYFLSKSSHVYRQLISEEQHLHNHNTKIGK